MKDKAINDAMCSIENRVRHVYNQGFNQGFEEGRGCKYEQSDIEAAYQRGLDDAWKCMEKICAEVIDGGLDSNTLKQIFGTASIVNIFKTNSASEAMTKLKEYEERKKQIDEDYMACKVCRFDWDNYEASGISYDEKHDHCIACDDYASGFEAVKCEDCDYSEPLYWEQDKKTGRAIVARYWCEKHQNRCDKPCKYFLTGKQEQEDKI